jgi:hypothetical protein
VRRQQLVAALIAGAIVSVGLGFAVWYLGKV